MKLVRWAVILLGAVLVSVSVTSCALGAETKTVSASAGGLTGSHSFPVNFPYAGEIVEIDYTLESGSPSGSSVVASKALIRAWMRVKDQIINSFVHQSLS